MVNYLDRYGWPVEQIRGRPIHNFIRRVLWTRKITLGKWIPPIQAPSPENTTPMTSQETPDAEGEADDQKS